MLNNDIFFINTPIEIQDEIYNDIIDVLSTYEIDENKIIYLLLSPILFLGEKYCFEVFLRDTILGNNKLDGQAEFLIFLK